MIAKAKSKTLPKLMTYDQAAEHLRVKASRLQAYCKYGQVPHLVEFGSRYLLTPESIVFLQEWLGFRDQRHGWRVSMMRAAAEIDSRCAVRQPPIVLKRRMLTEEDIAAIAKRKRAGESFKRIATDYERDASVLCRLLKQRAGNSEVRA